MLPNCGLVDRSRSPGTAPARVPNTISVIIGGGRLSQWTGLIRCFPKEAGFVVVRCSDSVEEVFSYCQKLNPCVLIVEQPFLEKVDPIDFTRLVDFGRAIQVLVTLSSEDSAPTESLLRMGCMGFLPQGLARSTLRRAARAVASGEYWAGRKLVSRVLQDLLLAESPRRLTPREREILKLIGQGYKNQAIAERLFISRETVRWHIRSLYVKIGVPDRLSAASYALEQLAEESLPAFSPAKKPVDRLKFPRAVLQSVG